jgi:exodeoxyribonuclease VII small subunit
LTNDHDDALRAVPVGDLSYREASRELDEIVSFFEQREVDVDQLVARLERATAIVDELDMRIRRTRAQVEQLMPRLEALGKSTRSGGLGGDEPSSEAATADREQETALPSRDSAQDAGAGGEEPPSSELRLG